MDLNFDKSHLMPENCGDMQTLMLGLSVTSKFAANSFQEQVTGNRQLGRASVVVGVTGTDIIEPLVVDSGAVKNAFIRTNKLDSKGISLTALMEDAVEKTSNRIAHAIKALKRKGLYADTYAGIREICHKRRMDVPTGQIELLFNIIGGLPIPPGEDGEPELTQEAWEAAIELAMYDHERKRMYSDELYALTLEDHIGAIYVYAMLINTSMRVAKLFHCDFDHLIYLLTGFDVRMEEIDEAIQDREQEQQQDGESQDTDANETQPAPEEHEPEDAETENAPDGEPQEHVSDWKRERAALLAKIAQLEKEAKPLHNKVRTLTEQNTDLETWITSRDERIQELEDAVEARDRTISDLSERYPETELPELPEDDIIFIGGHPNMLNKLSQAHPDWRIIGGHDFAFSEFTAQPLCVFFWDNHMAHSVYHRAKGLIGPNTPVVYLKSTNPDKLELEMRRGYAAAMKKGDNPDEQA